MQVRRSPCRLIKLGLLVSALVGCWLGWGAQRLLAQADAPGEAPAVAALRQAAGEEGVITLHPATGQVRFVRFAGSGVEAAAGQALSELAGAFLLEYGPAFGLQNPATELTLLDQTTDLLGMTHLRYGQIYQGVPVFGGELRLHFAPGQRLAAVNGVIIPALSLAVNPKLGKAEAAAIAQTYLQATTPAKAGNRAAWSATVQGRWIFRANLAQGRPGSNHLVYEVLVEQAPDVRTFVYVDAHTGQIVEAFNAQQPALQRRVYKATTLADPTALVWQEGDALPYSDVDPSDQTNVNKIIDYTAHVYNFFASLSGGSFLSWNGADGVMANFYDSPTSFCPNASWTGQAVSYCVDVVSDDLVAHEWAHGYSQSTHGLVYRWQPGALNEAYSDIWGETIDLLNGAGVDQPDTPRSDGACSRFTHRDGVDDSRRWLAFEDARGFGQALRDLWNPSCFGDPGKVSDRAYACGADDDGGVHTNSGVPNHAFALLVDGGVYNGQTVRGIGLTKAANLYWRAQMVYHTRTSDFADHADALEQACRDLVNAPLAALDTADPAATIAGERLTADDCAQVSRAIAAVELRQEPAQCRFPTMLNPTAPPLCQNEGPVVPLLTQDWETGLGAWTVGRRDILSPTTFSTPDWAVVSPLPDERPGAAAFVQNGNFGDGVADVESGVLLLESPTFQFPATALAPRLAFEHWFALEEFKDGGNLKISVNGGPWQLVPRSAFTFNPYNGSVTPVTGLESAFSGTNYATFDDGSWGQSRIDLRGLAQPGDDVRLRFELLLDRAGGIHGWYVDDVQAYYCQSCGNGLLNDGEACDDGNAANGDGCSALCQVEQGWFCKAPVAALGNRLPEPSRCIDLAVAVCRDLPLPIPDNDELGATSTITIPVPPAGAPFTTITDLDLYVEAQHSWLGDLTFSLVKVESGRQATLLDRPGSQTPGAFGCGGDDLAVLFDDESVLPAETGCSSSRQPAMQGNLVPGNGLTPTLTVFDGDQLAGRWALTVVDQAIDETGALVRWCLAPTVAAAEEQRLFLPLVGQ